MRANWLCGRFCVQASSFENYIAEKPFTDRFVQQSPLGVKSIVKYKNNKVVDSYTESTVKMYPIVPDTVGSSYLKSVCTQ